MMKETILTLSTEKIEEAIRELGGGPLEVNKMIVRAKLLEVYEERKGEDETDRFLAEIGM